MKKSEVYYNAINIFGAKNQLRQTQEECAELIVAINKYFRSENAPEHYIGLIEEIADVEIMIEQLKLIFDKESIRLMKNQKIERLEKLLIDTKKGV